MTVVSTIITQHFTAHACDSYLTRRSPDGTVEVCDTQLPKVVRVEAWRGALAYWGLALHGDDWNTLNWLRSKADSAQEAGSPETFASSLAEELTAALLNRPFAQPRDAGLGIHFTAYEWVADRWVPELFLVTNWTDATYMAVRPEGFRMSRETYPTLLGLPERVAAHGQPEARLQVHAALHDTPSMYCFNNGDPSLFNPVAKVILDTFVHLYSRGQVRDGESSLTHLSIVRTPVDVVSRLLADVGNPATRVIGGKPHDLSVSPTGVYDSRTGD